jgi:uncharacterized protein YebE (UPF0316 family)
MKIIVIFAVATIVNVVLSTMRSLMTINSGKWGAALMNAICYGFYTWVVVLTVADFDLWLKIVITAVANFVGVWVVKFIEEKAKKDKLWKVEMAIPLSFLDNIIKELDMRQVPYNYQITGKWIVFNCYCDTQAQTSVCVDLCKRAQGKISAYESKAVV